MMKRSCLPSPISSSPAQAFTVTRGLGGAPLWNGLTGAFLREYGPFLAAGVLFSLPVPEFIRDRLRVPANLMKVTGAAALLGLTFLAVTYVAVGSYNPFIYFNF